MYQYDNDLYELDYKHILSLCRTKWNFVDFKPGLVGGHCVPVDPYYLIEGLKNKGFKSNILHTSRKINEKFHKILLNALNSVVNEVGGTANKLFRDNPNYIKIAGKTGTSQVISIKESDREDDLYKEKQKEQLEKFKDHSVFVGYGPVDNPKYIASVIIENGGSGSSLAAPLAHEILNFAEKNNV